MKSPVVMFTHFHKDFVFNHNSSWVKACYAGGTGPYEWHPPNNNGEFINVTDGGILKYKKYYDTTEQEFLIAMGQQATDCYLANENYDAEYYGVGSYRRYLMISDSITELGEKVTVPASQEMVNHLTSDYQMEAALNYFKFADVITNRPRIITQTIEQQYLQYELSEYWNLFKEGIVKTNPSYKPYIKWLTDYNTINYEGVYIMRKDLFKRLVSEYFSIMEHIWQNCSEIYPDKNKKSYPCSEPLPWRYPGFLNERFVPFFVYANALRTVNVPLAFLN